MTTPAHDSPIGPATRLAQVNFQVSGRPVQLAIVRALVLVKQAMARANAQRADDSGVDAPMAEAIIRAADEVLRGVWDDQFTIDTFQTGSGTSTNMNVNEVLASLASRHLGGRSVHPNDHVNASQSTNDVFPTAIRIAVLCEIRDVLTPGLDELHAALSDRATTFADVVKAGRTHLMDASPITLGQEFGGYAAQIAEARERLADTMVRVAAVPLGGTATGNGLNAPPGVAELALSDLARPTGLALRVAPNRFASQASPDALVELSDSFGPPPPDCSRSPTTSACWRVAPRRVSQRSGSPNCSPDRRSCPARSTRSCARSSRRSPPKSSGTMRPSGSPEVRAPSR